MRLVSSYAARIGVYVLDAARLIFGMLPLPLKVMALVPVFLIGFALAWVVPWVALTGLFVAFNDLVGWGDSAPGIVVGIELLAWFVIPTIVAVVVTRWLFRKAKTVFSQVLAIEENAR